MFEAEFNPNKKKFIFHAQREEEREGERRWRKYHFVLDRDKNFVALKYMT